MVLVSSGRIVTLNAGLCKWFPAQVAVHELRRNRQGSGGNGGAKEDHDSIREYAGDFKTLQHCSLIRAIVLLLTAKEQMY